MGARRITSILVAVVAAAVSAVSAAPAFALKMKTCRDASEFVCGELRVPIDRTGKVKGTLKLAVAAQRRYPKGAGLMIALSGGPGQSSVSDADSFALSLEPALARYRLVVIDQRGTGGTALNCPELQKTGPLDPLTPESELRCVRRVGPRYASYGTRDTIADLEALRRAFEAPRMALMGISYGTWVALEYARAFPKRTERLILDSVLGPDAADPFSLDGFRALPRVITEQCRGGRCKGVTEHPVADIAAVAKRLRKGPIQATVYDGRGRARLVKILDEEQFALLVSWGDLNPFLQSRLPGAIAAARQGDYAPLVRLRPVADGAPTPARSFSAGLNVITGCLDAQLPYPFSAPVRERRKLLDAALAAVTPRDYRPWSRAAVRSSSYADDCLLFPKETPLASATLPIPDVPALILSGRLDTRTPLENGRATAAELPRARVVEVPGNGHDQVDTDGTGCVRRALKRWIFRERVGKPCEGKSNQVYVIERPPRSIAAFKTSKQVPGDRGRVLQAALETASEVRFAALETLFAGLPVKVGGLRGGRFSADDPFEGTAKLHGYSYVPGVRVSGRLTLDANGVRGTVRVRGRIRGELTLDTKRGASGVLGGRAVRFRRNRSRSSSAGPAGSGIPDALLDRDAVERRLTALGLR